MTQRSSAGEVYDEAARWAAKVDAGPLAPQEQIAFDRWLASDSRHFGAFAQASALLQPLERAGCVLMPQRRVFTRRHFAVAAASVAALVSFGVPAMRFLYAERYMTRIGEMRVIPLSDGSVISLNTDSEVVVRYSKAQRMILLMRGEALFDVAKSKQRPFIVRAGNTQVRAVGTSFTVRDLPGQSVFVLVREGVVEISRPDVPVAPTVRIAQNMKAVAPAAAPIAAASVDMGEVTRELAWRVGRIAFHGETLSQAAAEFARYSDIRIHIEDPSIARERITGLFVSVDPVGFSKAVATSFDLRADIRDKEIFLTR